MRCPRLAGNYMFSCSSHREVYIPNSFEYAEYCNSERYDLYKVCSRYRSDPQTFAIERSGSPERSAASRRQS